MSCRDAVPAECSVPQEPWITADGSSCYYSYLRGVYDVTDALVVTQEGLNNVNCSMNSLLRRYVQRTDNLQNWDEFGLNIVETCNNIPGLCDPFLQDVCPTITDKTTPTYQRICGCFNSPVCSAACNNINTIQRSSGNGYEQCTENRCIIDNLSLVSINSNLGSISVNQTCTGCTATNPCTCVFNATSSTSSLVGNAYQNFKTSSSCDTVTCSLNGEQVPCESLPTTEAETDNYSILWIVFIIVLVVILSALIISAMS